MLLLLAIKTVFVCVLLLLIRTIVQYRTCYIHSVVTNYNVLVIFWT